MISRVFVKPIAMQWLKSWVHSDISQGWTPDPTGLLPVCSNQTLRTAGPRLGFILNANDT